MYNLRPRQVINYKEDIEDIEDIKNNDNDYCEVKSKTTKKVKSVKTQNSDDFEILASDTKNTGNTSFSEEMNGLNKTSSVFEKIMFSLEKKIIEEELTITSNNNLEGLTKTSSVFEKIMFSLEKKITEEELTITSNNKLEGENAKIGMDEYINILRFHLILNDELQGKYKVDNSMKCMNIAISLINDYYMPHKFVYVVKNKIQEFLKEDTIKDMHRTVLEEYLQIVQSPYY
jgi:hypothetical protein